MKLVIIESPFANPSLTEHVENIRYARSSLRDSILRGEAPIAFHLLYTQEGVLNDQLSADRELGIATGMYWWEIADLHTFYTDRGWSRGMLYAWDWVRQHKRKYEFRSLGGEAKSPPDDLPPVKVTI